MLDGGSEVGPDQIFYAQELANPEVCPNMGFYPDSDCAVTVNQFSQSTKWREGLEVDLRVPMVDVNGEHFYLYEPAQLHDSSLVVPVYFYIENSGLRAKCLQAS